MDRQLLDRLLPIGYAALILASALFFTVALAPIAMLGALVLAVYYTAIRHRLLAAEQARDAEGGLGHPNE